MKTTGTLIHHLLEQSAASSPEAIAVVHGKNRRTYEEINRLANQLAHELVASGVIPGDRVVLLCENSAEYVFCYYGILKSGAIAVSLNTEMKPAGIGELLDELKPKALIISARHERSVQSIDLGRYGIRQLYVIRPRAPWPTGEIRVASLLEILPSRPGHNPGLKIEPSACAMIVYTSGSVGKPKGAMLTHANIVANTRSIVEYLSLTAQDIQMAVLPFFYVMGKSLLNTHVAVGGRVVINNQFAYTASVLKQMAEERVTGFSGVPSTFAHLLFKSPLAQYRDKLPDLRYCSQAGGHMPKSIKLELMRVLPAHTRLVVMYGATEASARLTYVPPDMLRAKIDSIGVPIPGVRMSVLSAEGAVLGPGETGELVAQGDNIMAGYYRDEGSTKKVLDRHGYHTGDLGYRDEDGYFFVTGRKDNQLKVGGHRVNPQEIEEVIVESGYAVECIVFGIPDPLLGHRLEGLVVPTDRPADAVTDILKYCSEKLPKHKVPESLALVESIPKNSSGKLDRNESIRLFNKLKKEYSHD
jgi:acyl-CoA synthetase (AMP-forming)/AMP-acid ligase II